MKRAFSGAQPTGIIHIGNYFGALKQWLLMQDKFEGIFSVVDLHALTTSVSPEVLRQNTLNLARLYLAIGLDPKKTTIFVQSHVPEHSELAWILGTLAKMGELSRMTQFKEKTEGKESANVGLFTYPVLMAADILLYKTDAVPVGEDQKQHVELTRNIAEKFNKKYGKIFVVPEVLIQKEAARIMALDDPSKKMSKSAANIESYISLGDDADTIKAKIKLAVTDSGKEIKFDEKNKPAISNLLSIYSLATNKSYSEIENEFQNATYGQFKEQLAESLIALLRPIQEKYEALGDAEVKSILEAGAQKAREMASVTMKEVRQRIGLV